MNKKSIKRTIAISTGVAALAGLIGWVTPTDLLNQAIENRFIKKLKSELAEYNNAWKEDRVYLQLDKPFYEPGENIWFSAFVRDGKDLRPSEQSEIVHVDLIGPKGNVEQTLNVIAKNGKCAGDFALAEEAPGGLYKIKAYTNWQKNDGENFGFEKTVQVQEIVLPNLKMKLDFEKKAFGSGDEVIAKLELNTNENKPLTDHTFRFVASLDGTKAVESSAITDNEGVSYVHFKLPKDLKTVDGLLNILVDYNGSTESVSRSIPIILNKIKFQLFPEGGDLVTNMQSNVAFRALNEFDKPADVEGVVMTEKGSVIETFSSYHMGMGSFTVKPQAGEKYFVKITKPAGIKETFELPEALPKGYVLSVDNSSTDELTLGINSPEVEELSVVAQVRGEIYYATAVNAQSGLNKVIIPVSKFPMGVAQITLFDSKGIERAERLAFVNKNKHLDVSVSTDKQKYLPREKVKMTVSVKDDRGIPMPADLSLAVVNDQLLSFVDDKSGNILSELLLQQDVKGKIEEPAFYFNDKETKSGKALDYLLMTAGWRKFKWEDLEAEKNRSADFQPENTKVSGVILDSKNGQPIKNALVKAGNAAYTTNENGEFTIKGLELYSPATLIISAAGYSQQVQYVYNYGSHPAYYMYDANAYRYDRTRSGSMLNELIPQAAMGAGVDDAPMREVKKSAAPFNNPLKNKRGRGEIASKRVPRDGNAKVAEPKAERKNDKNKEEARRADRFGRLAQEKVMMDEEMDWEQPAPRNVTYYRARKFAAPVYDKEQKVDVRTDFRSTIFWDPTVSVDRTGRKTIEFYNSDDISSFRVTVEGISSDGMIGRTENVFFTQLPFAMSAKVPVEVATSDIVSIPITLKNNTDKPLGGTFTITAPDGLQAVSSTDLVQTIMPGQAKVVYVDYKVLNKISSGDFSISFKSCGLSDAFTQNIKIVSKGFPASASFSGQEVEKEYVVYLENLIDGSLKATLNAYPNVVGDLMKGIEGILSEPYGCFEQTSCTAYPNAMVLDYMKSTDSKDDKTLSRATALLDKGYTRLTTFETKEKGYEWFGASPGHEGLTAYGLLEFSDMKKAGGNVDQKMVDRTAGWIMSHKDGKGKFTRNMHALHDYGRISDDILNAYIVYALAEAGYTDIKKEFETSYSAAMSAKDPYMLAMMANAAFKLNETKKAEDALEALLSRQDKNGSWTGSTHSITYSQGRSLTIETTAIAAMALMKAPGRNIGSLKQALDFIVNSRDGSGTFSSTQGTILALKALTQFAKESKKTSENGTIAVYVDGRKVAERSYKAGDKGAIVIDSLEKFLRSGKNTVKVKYIGVKEPLPYSVAVNWNTFLPASDKDCSVSLITKMGSKNAKVGETVRYSATIKNLKNSEIPSTMALIGIPAGLTVQPWQLKELQEKKVFDYYEIKGNKIAIYYRGMAANDVRQINLDLKAEVPGEFDTPASSGYLYYTNEFKCWSGVDRIKISKI